MTTKRIAPWRWGGLKRWESEANPIQNFRSEMEALRRDMDRLFEDFWQGDRLSLTVPESMGSMDLMPRVDETEDEKGFHVRVELPGMDQKDVDITMSDGFLTISGEKKQDEEETGKNFYRKERSFGSFRRVLQLPGDIDESKIDASFKKGVLSIELPKTEEARKKVKHISVKAA
jgi:HSP20 family protein